MKKYLITTAILTISFVSLMLLTFLLNDSKIKENVEQSMINYNFFDNKINDITIDNYTDMIMLNIITYNSNSPIVKRVLGNEYGFLYVEKNGDKEMYWNQYENLMASLHNQNDDSMLYGRYWHGSLTIVKPLLRFFTYEQSLQILTIIGLILIIISGYLVLKKLNIKYLITYIVGLLALNIYIFNTCYQYYFSLIMLIICIIILLSKYKVENFDSTWYFFIFGGLTSYFLYVSFPLITLCYPLLILLALKFKNDDYKNYKENIIFVIKTSLSWLIGYVLLFSLKWVLGTILVGDNFIENALMSVNQRLGITFSFNFFDVIKLNLNQFFSETINILIFIGCIILIIIKFRKNPIEKLKIFSPILIIFFMPFIWMLLSNNHSAVHYWMIYRLFAISLFSMLIILTILFDQKLILNNLEKLNCNDYIIIITSLVFLLLYELKIIFVLIFTILIFLLKIDKKSKLFILLLVVIDLFFLFGRYISKNNFSEKEFFQSTYNELYNKVIMYGNQYLQKNVIPNNTRIDIRDLIDTINSDSVFLLSCKGYIIVNNNEVTPYINCNDTVVTDGYID